MLRLTFPYPNHLAKEHAQAKRQKAYCHPKRKHHVLKADLAARLLKMSL